MPKSFEGILKQVESDFKMGGLSSGLYADYATEVAKRMLESYKSELIKDIEVRKQQCYDEDAVHMLEDIITLIIIDHMGYSLGRLSNNK